MPETIQGLLDAIGAWDDAGEMEGVIWITGLRPATLRQHRRQIVEAIEARQRQPLIVDCAKVESRRGALFDALSAWTQRHIEISGSTATLQILDYLTMAMDMGSEAFEGGEREASIADAAVRLVESLSRGTPTVLIVLEPQALAERERAILSSLVRHFWSEVLADVDPGFYARESMGCLWVGDRFDVDGVDAVRTDLGDAGKEQIRRFLNDPKVVDQLLASTAGDPAKIQAYFDALPDAVEVMSRRRVDALPPAARSIAEILAIAEQPQAIGFLDRLSDLPVVAAVRQLCDAGVARRRMEQGTVKVGLSDAEMGPILAGALSDEERKQVHRLLASAEIETGGGRRAFIAHHALAAGESSWGIKFGVPAARNLLSHGQWNRAGTLLVQLDGLAALDDDVERQVIDLRLRLAEARGQWAKAHELIGRLVAFDSSGPKRRHQRRRQAQFLARMGQNDKAEDLLRQLLSDVELVQESSEERIRILLVLAETTYRRGDHQQARQWIDEALAAIDDQEDLADEKLRWDARGLAGKIALFEGRLDEARQCFEACASQARHDGARSQQARMEANLGVVALQQGRFDTAAKRLERALEQAELPDDISRVRASLNLGIVRQRRSEFAAALKCYRNVLRDAMRCNDPMAYGVACHNLATLYQDMGAFDAARQMVAHLRQRHDASTGGQRFTLDWAELVEVQILLDEGKAAQALAKWRQIKPNLRQADQLYRVETGLRCVSALLREDKAKEAQKQLAQTDSLADATPQTRALRRYYEAALACRFGADAEDYDWYAIIDGLEEAGLYRIAVEARLELVSALEADDEHGHQSAALIVEQGVASLHRRAEALPERFRRAFYEIDSYRRLLMLHHRLNGAELPESLAPDSDEGADREDREVSTEAAVDRQDPAYRRWRRNYAAIIGEDQRMLQIFRFIDRVAPSETTVLLAGESGTGKELVAQAIHEQSERSEAPFIKVNCAAFVEELLLSELFGHEKGAFTGAIRERIGHFERAHEGTIFLDEIGDISPKTQVALLRVLQEGTFEPVGGTQTRTVDVRVVAATNRNLKKMVDEGQFRLDLYYRLKGFVIDMPPLRERRGDIPALLDHFVGAFGGGEEAVRFDDDAVQFLARYQWPGNVRELENFVRSALLFAEGDRIGMAEMAHFGEFFASDELDESLPPIDTSVIKLPEESAAPPTEQGLAPDDQLVEQVVFEELGLSELKEQLELKCIERALRETGGNISQAARLLHMKRPRLSQIVNGTPQLLSIKEELVG